MNVISKIVYKACQICQKVYLRLYSAFVRLQFADWGKGTTIEPPVKLGAPDLIVLGCNVHICEHAWLNAMDGRGDRKPTLFIEDGVYVGRFVHINALNKVVIEKNVLLADRVYVSDADHNYANISIPVKLQGIASKGAVRLKEGCWLGVGTVILPGVTVGRNSVVAANSVVTKSVPDYTVVAGVPARVLKTLGTRPE